MYYHGNILTILYLANLVFEYIVLPNNSSLYGRNWTYILGVVKSIYLHWFSWWLALKTWYRNLVSI